jgi:hypothetical protein
LHTFENTSANFDQSQGGIFEARFDNELAKGTSTLGAEVAAMIKGLQSGNAALVTAAAQEMHANAADVSGNNVPLNGTAYNPDALTAAAALGQAPATAAATAGTAQTTAPTTVATAAPGAANAANAGGNGTVANAGGTTAADAAGHTTAVATATTSGTSASDTASHTTAVATATTTSTTAAASTSATASPGAADHTLDTSLAGMHDLGLPQFHHVDHHGHMWG